MAGGIYPEIYIKKNKRILQALSTEERRFPLKVPSLPFKKKIIKIGGWVLLSFPGP